MKPPTDIEVESVEYNFGSGLVPSHRHPNGGGWVADTAFVDATAFIGINAEVFGNARVLGDASVYDDARVYGL